jgi:amidase
LPSEPPLRVVQGESFIVETVDTCDRPITSEADIGKPTGPMAGNPSTGPVYVEGIKANDVIAVNIEKLSVIGHTLLGTGDETLLPKELVNAQESFVRIEDGVAYFPGGFEVPVRPLFGCFGVVPSHSSPEPWHHGGNMDIPDICAGNVVHVKCQRDGAFFFCGDGHAIQGDGEVNTFSVEVPLEGKLCIERSPYQEIRTILIETPGTFITVGIEHRFGDSVRSAVQSMADLLSRSKGVNFLDAYQLASHVGDLRLGAVWPMWSNEASDIPIPACFQLSKEFFQ